MKERPPWLKVVGGKDHKPSVEDSRIATPEQLTNLFVKIVSSNMPADLGTSINDELLSGYKLELRSWTVDQIYGYLSRTDIWARPTFTKAVMDEVQHRIKTENFLPNDETE